MPTTRSTDFIHPANGTYELTGFRGHDGTARFTLVLNSEVVFENADWPTAWKVMAGKIYKANHLADLFRSVTPSMESFYAEQENR